MNMFSTHDYIQFVVLATVNNTTARLDLIGAHWDITLFLLCGGVQGANNTSICHLLYMWACMYMVFTTRFKMLSVFIVAGQRS